MTTNRLAELERDGWVSRFTASGARLTEAVEEYRALGFAVKTIPAHEIQGEGCTECFQQEGDDTMLILTRESDATEENHKQN